MRDSGNVVMERLLSPSGAHVRDSLRARHESGDPACREYKILFVLRRSTYMFASRHTLGVCCCVAHSSWPSPSLVREAVQDVLSLFASTCTASRRAPATLCRSQPLCQQLHGVLTRCPVASTRPPMPILRRRKRRRSRCAKEARDTLAAVNFVYVIAGTDFFESFSVYSSPFLSLFSTVFFHLFVSDLVWEWRLCLCRTAPCTWSLVPTPQRHVLVRDVHCNRFAGLEGPVSSLYGAEVE